jgi:hypothetical protein
MLLDFPIQACKATVHTLGFKPSLVVLAGHAV